MPVENSNDTGFRALRGRAWAYTFNNYTEEHVERFKSMKCLRHACAKEVCPTTGTPHLQGYIRFEQPVRGSWWLNNFHGIHAALKYRESSERQATGYITDPRAFGHDKDPGELVINFGVDDDRPIEKGLSRKEEARVVMDEIDQGATWGQIRHRHRDFAFWNRSATLWYGKDKELIKLNQISSDCPMPLPFSSFRCI